MENRGLLFIPDISGFTRFITETEIDHSRKLIQELLEVVIDANEIGLEVSEVEGDAVLFFRFGDRPDVSQLQRQVERMFRAFHGRLMAYDIGRFCQCRACVSASKLTLKVITHYGEFTSYSVRQFNKLIGRDVIVAHQLLKNDIDHHEYWLVTPDLLPDGSAGAPAEWVRWVQGSKSTEAGVIPYHYTSLSSLKQDLPPARLPDLGLGRTARMFSASREYDTHIIALFHAAGNFSYRSQWQDGVERVEELDHHLPRIGTRCRRIMTSGESIVYMSSYSFRPDHIEFTETDEAKTSAWHYTLERVTPERTKLTVDYHIRKGFLRELLFRLTQQRSMEASLQTSLRNLDSVTTGLRVSAEY